MKKYSRINKSIYSFEYKMLALKNRSLHRRQLEIKNHSYHLFALIWYWDFLHQLRRQSILITKTYDHFSYCELKKTLLVNSVSLLSQSATSSLFLSIRFHELVVLTTRQIVFSLLHNICSRTFGNLKKF